MNANQEIHDRLRKQLADEAIAERPAFSPAMHNRMMLAIQQSESVRQPSSFTANRWLMGAAAGLLFATGVVFFAERDRVAVSQPPLAMMDGQLHPNESRSSPDVTEVSSKPVGLNFNVGSIISAQTLLPRFSIRLPINFGNAATREEVASLPVPPPIGSPEWLFARFQEPANRAQAAMAELMPPNMRGLGGEAK